MNWLGLLPLGGALAARLGYRHLAAWIVWVATCLIAFLAVWIQHDPTTAFRWITGTSAVGFLAPELWHAFRQFIRQSRVVGWAIMIAAAWYLIASHPDFLLVGLQGGVVLAAFGIMLRPLWKSGKSQKK